MINLYFLLSCIFPCLIAYSNIAYAATITWVAQNPDNDINDPANWSPHTIPGSGDEAVFDSTISGINTSPTESSSSFSVSTFNFLNNASRFNFNFNNSTLTFNGIGITGSHTNPFITVTNTNNSSFPGNLISFLGGTGTSGGAIITSTNSGTLTGSVSNTGISAINSNLYSTGAFTITRGGNIAAYNTGDDSSHGSGNNGTANTESSQLRFDQSFTAGDNVAISASNSGTFSGTNSVQGDAVAIINGSQFVSSGAFQVGDNFNCELQNTGTDSSVGVGLSNIGQLNAAQMVLQTTGTAGDNCTITLSNTGINYSQATHFSDFIGYLNDQQFFVGNSFQAGDNFSLITSNTGTDASNGFGSCQVAVINSNSGTTGNQILFQQGFTLGDHATISATNKGTYSGTNTNGGSNIAGMNLQQIAIGDSASPGSYAFTVGDSFSLSASNSGIDSSNGIGANAVGDVSTDQITIFTPVTLGDSANITITNSGNFSGHASSTYVNVGSVGGSQLNCESSVSAGSNFTLNVSNSGTNTGRGVGDYFIGDLIDGQQVTFQNNFIAENNASITISNSGISSSNTTVNNQVGSLMGYGKQLLAKNQFQVGNDFLLNITNSGFDDSTGAGGNFVGFMNNNTVDNSASQLHLAAGGTVGDRASITLSNTGTYQGTNTASGNIVGALSGKQLYSVHNFQAGDNFELTVSNSGIDNASCQNSNNAGIVNGSQVEFGDACMLGNNASIVLSNSGTNNDTIGTLNNIGIIGGSQMVVDGNFTAGTNLNISANNTITNGSNSNNNNVGSVSGSQIFFAQNCTLNNGSIISAFNSGSLGNSQIVFGQGFDIASGKVTIQAVNQGTMGAFGIDIQGNNAGGNAHIVLENSSLNVATTLPTFTIAGLVGDATSIVQSQPQLIINTDALTQTEFFGTLQNFPAVSSTLMKTGTGTQILSGSNTYTGLTTVQEGTLVVNGSLAGDVFTASAGVVKGNGAIAGTLTNMGVTSPGESIGRLTLGNFTNNNGTYAVEVNGRGQNDLLDVSGTARLNGGTVLVSSSDGTFRFQQPYTIVTAEEGVVGTFNKATSLAFITPTLTYDPDNVYLTLHSALLNAAKKCNQLGVATNLDNIVSPDAAQSLLIGAIASLPLEAAQEAMESLSGFQYTNDVWVTNISTSRFLRRLYNPQRALVTGYDRCSSCNIPCNEWTRWLEIGYGFTNLHGNNAKKLNFDSYQLTGGIQKTLCKDFTFGLAGSYEYDNIKYRNGRANRNSAFASIYGLYHPKAFYGLFDIVYGCFSLLKTHNCRGKFAI
jgi:autotransporter-associated beta strand protein